MISKEKIKNLVISGGGSYICAQTGALHYLNKHGYLDNIENYAGTSSGAILSFLLNIGFKPKDIDYFFSIVDSKKLTNNQFSKILNDYGIDDGSILNNIFTDVLNKKYNVSDITFNELFNLTNKKLYIIASCINDVNVTQYFSNEKTPEMSVLKALRMSFAIPFYYTPVIIDNKFFIDGGLSNNYPMDLFSKENTLGITTLGELPTELPTSIEAYTVQLLKAVMHVINTKKVYEYENNSIIIKHMPDILGIDITPSHNTFLKLRKHGYMSAKNKLDNKTINTELDNKTINIELDNKTINIELDNKTINTELDNKIINNEVDDIINEIL